MHCLLRSFLVTQAYVNDFFFTFRYQVSIDRFVKLNCQPTTSKLTKRLRSHLDELLEHKISYPGVSDWSSDCREGALLQAIVELLSSEVQGVEFEQGEGEEDDD